MTRTQLLSSSHSVQGATIAQRLAYVPVYVAIGVLTFALIFVASNYFAFAFGLTSDFDLSGALLVGVQVGTVSGLCGGLEAGFEPLFSPRNRALQLSTQEPRAVNRKAGAGRALELFAWFCRGETRVMHQLAAADLREDVRDMRKKGCGRWHILAVRFWITTTTIVPIVWDGCVRISKKLPLLGSVVRAVSAFLRKIDPPRLG